MKEFSYTITDPVGIHARPAGLLVKTAKQFKSDIKLIKGTKTADLKKIFAVMTLGVKQGDSVKVSAEGIDEDIAINAVAEILRSNL